MTIDTPVILARETAPGEWVAWWAARPDGPAGFGPTAEDAARRLAAA